MAFEQDVRETQPTQNNKLTIADLNSLNHDNGDPRTPSQKEAGYIHSDETGLRTSANENDRQEALAHLQREVTQINKGGFEFAKSVYQDLRKMEASGEMPMIEFTDAGLSTESAKALHAQAERESHTEDSQQLIQLNQDIRKHYGLPPRASETQVYDAELRETGIDPVDLRKGLGLSSNATSTQVEDAFRKKQADQSNSGKFSVNTGDTDYSGNYNSLASKADISDSGAIKVHPPD